MTERARSTELSVRFVVGEVEGVGWIAVTPKKDRIIAPRGKLGLGRLGSDVYFCVRGETKEEAEERAFAAFKFFCKYKQNKKDDDVSVSHKNLPFRSVNQIFVPREVVLANVD